MTDWLSERIRSQNKAESIRPHSHWCYRNTTIMTTRIRNCKVSYVNNKKSCKCKGSGGTASVIRNFVTRWSTVCKFKPRLLYPVPTSQVAGRTPDRLCTFRKTAQSPVSTENRTAYYKVHNLVTTPPELFTKHVCCISSIADCQIWCCISSVANCQIWGFMNSVADWPTV